MHREREIAERGDKDHSLLITHRPTHTITPYTHKIYITHMHRERERERERAYRHVVPAVTCLVQAIRCPESVQLRERERGGERETTTREKGEGERE